MGKDVILAAPIAVAVGAARYELKPTIQAVRAISRALGGLAAAARAVREIDPDATAAVIIAGAGLRLEPDEVDALVNDVWQGDLGRINGKVLEFLAVLLNGGAPVRPASGEDPNPEGRAVGNG